MASVQAAQAELSSKVACTPPTALAMNRELFGEFDIIGDHHPADQVGVPVDVLWSTSAAPYRHPATNGLPAS